MWASDLEHYQSISGACAIWCCMDPLRVARVPLASTRVLPRAPDKPALCFARGSEYACLLPKWCGAFVAAAGEDAVQGFEHPADGAVADVVGPG